MSRYVIIKIKVLCPRSGLHRKVKQNDNLCPVQDSASLAVFKVTARDQGHYKGPSGAFVTYCNISCSFSTSLGDGSIWADIQILKAVEANQPMKHQPVESGNGFIFSSAVFEENVEVVSWSSCENFDIF